MSNKQRRKGNAQGASSSRAAELLQASGGLGFDALSLIPGLVDETSDVSALMDEIGLNVDPGLRIIFKKLSKRDAQTREKAIKELLEELKASVTDTGKIKNSFPCFASAYPKLISDCSPVVRGVSDSVLALYITTLKKEAGPQLKTVIPFLFFSGQDGYHTVVNNAEAAIKECFPTEEKNKLAVDTFGQDVVGICLQILAKQHKLVLPQKFTEEESDAQRQTRLFAQSVNTLEKFLDCAPGLTDSIGSQFASSATFNTLMNLDVTVKAAAFRLLQKLIRKDVGLILQTRIPSFILQNLSAEDTLLCKNCFECFIVAASDPRFYEVCKIDKAVIPKILHLVRKKGLHWNVLESSLLPSISVIYENLQVPEKEKWLKDVILSFFDDVESGIPLQSWSKAISEALKFSFLKSSELNKEEFLQFLLDQVLRFIGIAVSFGEKQPVDIVVDFLTWIESKNEVLGETFVKNSKEKILQKLLNLLPKSISIVEGYINSIDDFKTSLELLKNEKCPNETFLRIFKSLDFDAIDLKEFGSIISTRIKKEDSFGTLKKLISILLDLIEDGEVAGNLKNYIPEINSSTAWALVEVITDDTVEFVDDLNNVIKIIIEDILKGRVLIDKKFIKDFLEDRFKTEEKEKLLKNIVENSESIVIEDFLNLVIVVGKVGDEFGKFLLEKLANIFIENPEDEDGELIPDIREKTIDFGPQLSQNTLDEVIKKVSNEEFSVKNVLRLSNLLANINLSREQILEFIPQREFVKDWIQSLGSKYLLNLVTEPDTSRLLQISISSRSSYNDVNLSTGVRLAIFYGNFAYLSTVNSEDDKSVFCNVAVFLLTMEYAAALKSKNGMFSPEGVEFKEFQNLMNIIDRVLQDSRFEYLKFFSDIEFTNQELFTFVYALNDFCKLENRRHTTSPTVEIPKDLNAELLQIIEDCEEASKNPEIGAVFLQQFSDERRKEYEDWMFNFGLDDKIKEAVSCAMLKLFSTVIGKIELSSAIRDFMLCGHVCAMQSVTEVLENLNNRGTVGQTDDTFFSQLAGYYCLKIFDVYDVEVKSADSTVALEWSDFYKPAAIRQIISWFYFVVNINNQDLSDFLIKKICTEFMKLDYNEIKETDIPSWIAEKIELDQFLKKGNLDQFSKFAIFLILNNFKDYSKFSGIYILKTFMLDLFKTEKEEDWGEEGPSDEQIKKESSSSKDKNLPHIIEEIFSSSEFTVLKKLMIWDSYIQFLSELDVLSRVKYVMHLPVKYSDEFLNIIFELLPIEPEKHLKELSFKGKLDIKRVFSDRFDIQYSDSTTFGHYICNLFFRTCTTLPSIVREWFFGLPKSKSGEVNSYVKKYLSPLLIARELRATSNIKKGRLSITVMPAVHEIQAGYKFDDATLLLQISLADDYPLSNPTVEAQRAIVNKDVLRKWLLQLIQFLKNENGLMYAI